MQGFQRLNDDSLSFSESFVTASSSSTIWGPGALSGKALKAMGGMSLDLLCHLAIRVRLAKIKRTIEKTPQLFHDPRDANEALRMKEYYSDLKELCKPRYSLSIRHAAGSLIRKITLNATPQANKSPSRPNGKTPTQWEVLLTTLVDASIFPNAIYIKEEEWLETVDVAKPLPQVPMDFRPRFLSGPHSESPGDLSQDQMDQLFYQTNDVLGNPSDPQNDHLKVLLLGAGGTGKSTITKLMEYTLRGPLEYPFHVRQSYQDMIIGSVSATVKTILHGLLQVMQHGNPTYSMSGEPETMSGDTKSVEAIRKAFYNKFEYPGLLKACHDIRPLWSLPEVRQAAREVQVDVDLSGKAALDSAEYFLDTVDRIFMTDYVPTTEDILRSRGRTMGIEDIPVKSSFPWRFVDTGGERSQRNKWRHCFNVTAVLFVVALPDYNRVLSDDPSINGLDDSLEMFSAMTQSPQLMKSLLILVFTKGDVLEEELKHDSDSLRNWARDRLDLPDYDGKTYSDACKYIENLFTDGIQDQKRPFCVQYLRTVDGTNMQEKLKCQAILAEIIQYHKSSPPLIGPYEDSRVASQ